MQHDTGIPFDQIHSSVQAMYENIEKIIDLALGKVENDEPLKLRFITPLCIEAWEEDEDHSF
jgi:hypothetical protein